jgi:sugar phosphate isomerase/epimerase
VTTVDQPELLANFWTLAGNHRPGGAPQVSTRDLCARIEAAAQAGFSGFGFGYADLMAWSERLGLPRLAKTLRDCGVKCCEFEFVPGWWQPGAEQAKVDSAAAALQRVVDALHAPSSFVKCWPDRSGTKWPTEVYAAGLGRLAEVFERVGARVGLEFVSFSDISTPTRALGVAVGAGPSAGVAIDVWHVVRSAVPFSALAAVPAARIVHVELNDGDLVPAGALPDDARDRRRLCGDGSFDLRRFIASIEKTGYNGQFGVEILSTEQRGRELRDAAKLAYGTANAQFSGLSQREPG